jgi:hypothetical protein
VVAAVGLEVCNDSGCGGGCRRRGCIRRR